MEYAQLVLIFLTVAITLYFFISAIQRDVICKNQMTIIDKLNELKNSKDNG